jgi:TonB-linked SusC/RagA family outer membrane protein
MGQSWTNKVRRLGMLCAINLSLCLNCFAGVDQGEKKVTLNVVEESCVKVFKQIEKQTKMSFFYSTSDIKLPGKVSLNVVNAALDEVMERILEGTGLEWVYTDNIITIRKKKVVVGGGNGMGSVADSSGNMLTVTGKVTASDGEPIPGATVRVKRTGDGVTTDGEGEFSLPKTRKNDLLLVSSIGYETREIAVRGNSVLIKLNIVVNDLDETVVIAYGTSTKRMLTGSVSRVTSDVISKQPVTDPIIALQGRVPGLYITQSSGIPGSNITVRLRGQNSIANGNEPLYIVDGVPFLSTSLTNSVIGGGATTLSPFSNINPADIESIEVLKDADATAIYGSRGANGVILITTKKGKVGKANFDITTYTGAGKVTRMLDLLNTQQYLEMRHEALKNDGLSTAPDWAHDINGSWDTSRYTDWQKIFIGGTSHVTNGQASVSGGSANTQFIIRGGYHRETTIFPGDFVNKKGSLHAGINHLSNNKKFGINFSSSYLTDKNVIPTYDFTSNIFLPPNAPKLYNSNGNLNWENDTWENPFASLHRKAKSSSTNLISNLNLSYRLFSGLEIKTSLGYNNTTMDQSILTPLSSYSPTNAGLTFLRNNSFATASAKTWIIEPQINYRRSIGKGDLDILFGLTFQETNNSSVAQVAYDFTDDALIENIAAAAGVYVASNNQSLYRYNALFGRINYNWQQKYLINVTARRDGSSRFGPGKQFGNFGAVGLGWIFSKERSIERLLPILSYGKIRASYGTNGNDRLTDYQYLSSYSSYSFPYLGTTGLYPTRIANPFYGWEMIKKLEAGLELGFIKDRILFTINYYRNRTNNQLVGYALPSITGFTSIQANLPAIIQNTGWEFELNTVNFRKNHFAWTSSINLSIPRNKLVSYPNLDGSSYANKYVVGEPLFIYKSYGYTGVDPQTGVYTFEDLNKDGSVTYPQDLKARKQIAQNYFGGLQNSFSYKGLQLDVFFQFVKQTGRVYPSGFGIPGFAINQPVIVLDRWRKSGDKSDIQKFTQTPGQAQQAYTDAVTYSDKVIGDASFIRLKNLSLSYSLPEKLVQKAFIQNCKVYVQCQNLFTITNYEGLDPETQSISLPPLRMFTSGIQLIF